MTLLILILSAMGLAPAEAAALPVPACETDTECYELCLAQGELDCDDDFLGMGEEE